MMPNFRAVSAGALSPPPTAEGRTFIIATQNSFDYSAFVFVAITSLVSEATSPTRNSGEASVVTEITTGEGLSTRQTAITSFSLHCPQCSMKTSAITQWAKAVSGSAPSIRPLASLSRRSYHGHNTFNISEVLGRGIAQGISGEYTQARVGRSGRSPRGTDYELGRDALTNVFREFWPDIAVHVLHRHP